MLKFENIRNYVIIKDRSELNMAKQIDICRYIVMEKENNIFLWSRLNNEWTEEKYSFFGENKEKDEETTGFEAYQNFYYSVGKENVEKMKHIYTPIALFESYEQLHYANFEFSERKIYQDIFVFDANSAFTYGTLQLPTGFEPLKEYMEMLYEKKRTAKNKVKRSHYKNLQNYLIGYFARINDFIRVRSEIIKESNLNIEKKMIEIVKNKGTVYLSNTDSIVTDYIGAEIMDKYKGDNVGQFKLEQVSDKLFYKSSNSYQIGDKVVYSGLKYFERKNTDFFQDKIAEQKGTLIIGKDYSIENSNEEYNKICKVDYGKIIVNIYNTIGELLKIRIYNIA